jgi:putative endonuclease
MGKTTREIGNHGEDIAVAYLESKDWLIFDRNYFFEKAEVDLVATDRNYIVFVEVKYRTNTYFGEPEDFITPKKEENIRKASEAWLYERKMETAVARFDVISITQKGNNAPNIKHFKDVFR